MTAEKDKLAEVISIDRQKPHPIPPQLPHGTPSPEDTLIEMYDLVRGNKERGENGQE